MKVITRKYIEREREKRDSFLFFLIEVQAVCLNGGPEDVPGAPDNRS